MKRISHLAVFALAACTTLNPYCDKSKPHHRPDGFTRNYLDNSTMGAGSWKWQMDRLRNGLSLQNAARVPVKTVDSAYLSSRTVDQMTQSVPEQEKRPAVIVTAGPNGAGGLIDD